MIEAARRKTKAGSHVFRLEIGHLLEDLLAGQSRRQEIEYVGDPNAHSAHAGAAATLARIDGDSIGQIHDVQLRFTVFPHKLKPE